MLEHYNRLENNLFNEMKPNSKKKEKERVELAKKESTKKTGNELRKSMVKDESRPSIKQQLKLSAKNTQIVHTQVTSLVTQRARTNSSTMSKLPKNNK